MYIRYLAERHYFLKPPNDHTAEPTKRMLELEEAFVLA